MILERVKPVIVRLPDVARSTLVYDLVEPLYSRLQIRRWERAGRPLPPPSAVKRETLRRYARRYGLNVLLETGTFKADTVRALRRDFRTIYSIEVDATLHQRAKRRCAGQRNAVLLRGDSAVVLPEVVARLESAALCWLDAHFSGGRTGTAQTDTPVLAELRTIMDSRSVGHIVLIDDHREFVTGARDYPSMSEVESLVAEYGYVVEAAEDILRITPASRR